jgi:DNA-binding transcriptional ArsR family regulator
VADAAALSVIDNSQAAASVLNPVRRRILGALMRPDSASGLGRRLGVPRQQLNYHMKQLEQDGLLELVEERRKRGCIERIVRATARSYLIAPSALGELAADPRQIADRLSSSYLLATAAKVVQDVAALSQRAAAAGKRLATFTLETTVRFASPADQEAFARELTEHVATLVARYNTDVADAGRSFRFIVAGHPAPAPNRAMRRPMEEESHD